MADFAWLIEAPGPRFLGARCIGGYHHFYWSSDANEGVRFVNREQADACMMSIRAAVPALFAFAVNLGDASPREHGWLSANPAEEGL